MDTNIIVDLLGTESGGEAEWSRRFLRTEPMAKRFVCNLVVVAELAAQHQCVEMLYEDLDQLRVEVVDLVPDAAIAAGLAHREYRRRGGKRLTILADFLIAAHAQLLGARFMTRDRRLASYFPELTLITPDTDDG